MIEQRTTCRLKDGENMEIPRIVPPEKDYFADLAQLFGHKPETIVKTLLDRLQDIFCFRHDTECLLKFFLNRHGMRYINKKKRTKNETFFHTY